MCYDFGKMELWNFCGVTILVALTVISVYCDWFQNLCISDLTRNEEIEQTDLWIMGTK